MRRKGGAGMIDWKRWVQGMMLVPVAVLGISAVERQKIKEEHYVISSKHLPEEFHETSFVFLSDLHEKQFGKENLRLLEKIKEINPDLVLVGGDLVVGKAGHTTKVAEDLMVSLAARYPVICANGNHEYRMKCYREIYGKQYDRYVERLRSHDIIYLENETVEIRKGSGRIFLSGLDLVRRFYQRGKKVDMPDWYLTKTLGRKREFHILLAHNPIYFPEYEKWGADLVLSGHNHGGLIRIPHFGGMVSPQVKFFPEFDAGYYRRGNSQMIISRGLGTHTLDIRVGNLPELSVIHLVRE